jgi:predicted transcriptional regulator of viral defense system
MVIDYIIENYTNGEPIFLDELPGNSKDYLRQEMKKLVDEGKLERLYNGVYYLPYLTILGTKGRISVDKYIDKKYLNANGEVSGYVTGLQLANKYGFTTQNPSCYEICSNEATTKQRKQDFDGNIIIVYKPVDTVTERNKSTLQFLDLMTNIDRYSEIKGAELLKKLRKYVKTTGLDFSVVKEYLPFYPDKVYRNIYEGGLMGELV